MANELRTEVEQVKQQEAVKQALKPELNAAPDRVLFPKGNAL